jgi:hypothetical protein
VVNDPVTMYLLKVWAIPVAWLAAVLLLRRSVLRRWKFLAAVIAIAAFPGALAITLSNGYDFPVYYAAGRGIIRSNYVYSERIAPIFKPLSALPYPVALAIFASATTAAYIGLASRTLRSTRKYPVLGVVCLGCIGLAALYSFRFQNIGPLLAFACLSPMGAVLAMCIKPHLCVFVVLHAAIACSQRRSRTSLELSSVEVQPDTASRVSLHNRWRGNRWGKGRVMKIAINLLCLPFVIFCGIVAAIAAIGMASCRFVWAVLRQRTTATQPKHGGER